MTNQVKTYKVEVIETISKVVEVEATSEDNALDQIHDQHNSGELGLMHDDDAEVDTSIEIFNDDKAANKYTITAIQSVGLYCEIEADTLQEAQEKAYEIDGGDFTVIEGSGDWHVSDVTEGAFNGQA